MDGADLAGTLAWEGTAFKTDLVPGGSGPEGVLTDVVKTGPTTLEITWTGGDGSNDIQISTNGTDWTTVATGVASGAEIEITEPSALIRVVEP